VTTNVIALPSPSLQRLRIRELHVDPVVQRRFIPHHAKKIAKEFDQHRLRTFAVSKRSDDELVIVDGQHRWAAAKQAGHLDLPVMCEVYEGLTTEQEAHLFVVSNALSKAPTVYDTFSKKLLSGDPDAVKIDHVVQGVGLEISDQVGTDKIAAVGACEWIYKRGGVSLLDETLTVLRATWPTDRSAYEATIMKAVATILQKAPEINLNEFATKLRRHDTAGGLLGQARGYARQSSTPTLKALIAVMVNIYNKKRSTRKITV
jgi:hypothetical protein